MLIPKSILEEVPVTKWFREDSGLVPVLLHAGNNAVHHHYFGCPVCGAEVGGFIITSN